MVKDMIRPMIEAAGGRLTGEEDQETMLRRVFSIRKDA